MNDTKEMLHFNLDLSPELYPVLEELAQKIGGSKSDVLRQAITLMQIMVTACIADSKIRHCSSRSSYSQ